MPYQKAGCPPTHSRDLRVDKSNSPLYFVPGVDSDEAPFERFLSFLFLLCIGTCPSLDLFQAVGRCSVQNANGPAKVFWTRLKGTAADHPKASHSELCCRTTATTCPSDLQVATLFSYCHFRRKTGHLISQVLIEASKMSLHLNPSKSNALCWRRSM